MTEGIARHERHPADTMAWQTQQQLLAPGKQHVQISPLALLYPLSPAQKSNTQTLLLWLTAAIKLML